MRGIVEAHGIRERATVGLQTFDVKRKGFTSHLFCFFKRTSRGNTPRKVREADPKVGVPIFVKDGNIGSHDIEVKNPSGCACEQRRDMILTFDILGRPSI